MDNIKFFELTDAEESLAYFLLSKITARCAGFDKDPDTGQDWKGFKNVTISIVRSSKGFPEAMDVHNVVSGNVYEFTVEELAKDAEDDDCNPKVMAIGKVVSKLAIRRCSSHFFLKVELD